MRVLRQLATAIDAQRGHLFPWSPVCLGGGIGLYFVLPAEPGAEAWAFCAALAAVLGWGAWRAPASRPVLLGALLAIAGLGLAGLRAHAVAAPVLDFRYYGPVQGRIVTVDRSASDKVRLTLDRVVLERTPPERTPERVRVSLHGEQGFIDPVPGLEVLLTANLSPPQGPVEPGGFDFQRQAWFQGIGAVGYTRAPALAAAPVDRSGLWMAALRARISGAVQAALPGQVGAFAAAITTGDRSGMERETLESLRASNLAHLLAISGLHLGLLTAFVFATVRYGLAALPAVALRVPVKKAAAVVALGAGAFYLGLSGGNVATERAFIMAAVVLLAVLLDRRALSLRAVALAALIVLVLRPEALVSPGFQMSFAATTALVAAYGGLRDWRGPRMPAWLKPVGGVLISSAIAGAATAPFGAAHFNQVAHYGLLANVLSVPLMGAVIIPGAVLAALLAPFGAAWLGLAAMAPAIGWILWVSDLVSGFAGAVSQIRAPAPAVLPLIALGGLTLFLWQGRGRLAGLGPLTVAAALWAGAERPHVLISSTGGLVGVLTEEGRAINKTRGEGFAALSWLENDGDAASQAGAAGRSGFVEEPDGSLRLRDLPLVQVTGRNAAARAALHCVEGTVLVLSAEAGFDGPCRVLDRPVLEAAGGVALVLGAEGLSARSVRAAQGDRLWTGGGVPSAEDVGRKLAAFRF